MWWARERSAMSEKTERTVVAGIGDLHVAETAVHPFRDLFAEISEEADVLALCGDQTNLGLPREAEILAEDLRSCPIPVVGVLGNNDFESGQAEEVARVLRQAGVCFLEEQVQKNAGIGFAGNGDGTGRRRGCQYGKSPE